MNIFIKGIQIFVVISIFLSITSLSIHTIVHNKYILIFLILGLGIIILGFYNEGKQLENEL